MKDTRQPNPFVRWGLVAQLVLVLSYAVTALSVATKYVDNTTSGSCSTPVDTDYNPATGTCGAGSSTVYSTVTAGLRAQTPGDILYFRAGTYTESTYGNAATDTMGGGATSWAGAAQFHNYPGEVVVLNMGFVIKATNYAGDPLVNSRYIIIEGDVRTNFVFNAPNWLISSGPNHIRIRKTEQRNSTDQGLLAGGTPAIDSLEFIDNYSHDNGNDTNQEHAFYGGNTTNARVQNNYFFRNQGYAVQFQGQGTDRNHGAIISGNIAEGRKVGATSSAGCFVMNSGSGATGNKIYDNVCIGLGGGGVKYNTGIQIGTNLASPEVYNNTIYDVAGGIQNSSATATIRNNILAGTTTHIEDFSNAATMSHNLCPPATPDCSDAQATNSVETATPGFVTPGSDFRLVAGSAAINAGTTSIRPCNGICDIGAFLTFRSTGGTVSGNVAILQMNMNYNTPFVVGLAAGYEVYIDGAPRTVTGAALSGSSAAALTFDGPPCAAGEVITAAYLSGTGTATDSAAIGGTTHQRLNGFGTVTLTNNCVGAGYTLTQTAGAIYAALGPQATTAQIHDAKAGGMVAVRTKWKATGADPPTLTTKFQYSVTGEAGTFADLPDTFDAGNVRYVGLGNIANMASHGTSTVTERLASEFAGMISGGVVRCFVGCEAPAVDLAQDSETEQVDLIEFDTDAVVGTVYWFRRVLADGTVMTYAANSKPSITITAPSSSGFANLQPSGLTVNPNPTVGRTTLSWVAGECQTQFIISFFTGGKWIEIGRTTNTMMDVPLRNVVNQTYGVSAVCP